jgi:heme A synthase
VKKSTKSNPVFAIVNRFVPSRELTARIALLTLAFNLAIILGGALVRATGSGAGCGAHWPLCDGTVVPEWTSAHRVIEFSHRASVGVGLALVCILWYGVKKAFRPGHPARFAAHWSLLFTVSESLIGAGLVLFRLVAKDASVYRAVAVSAHLVNTFLLVASLTLTAWWASESKSRARWRGQGHVGWLLGLSLAGLIFVGMTGAVTALGDTLFPASGVGDIGRAVSANAHFLRQLRVYHPVAAVSVGLFCLTVGWLAAAARPSSLTRGMAYWVSLLVSAQIGLGFANLLLLAPLAMQLSHLLLADALWIAMVLLAASALAEDAPRAIPAGSRMTVEGTQ